MSNPKYSNKNLNKNYYLDILYQSIDSGFKDISEEIGDNLSMIELMHLHIAKIMPVASYDSELMDKLAENIDFSIARCKKNLKQELEQHIINYINDATSQEKNPA